MRRCYGANPKRAVNEMDGLDERSILIIENLIWAYENCNIADNKLIRDFIDCGINHIKTQAKENAELIEKIDKLESKNARLKAESDAAVEALGTMTYPNCSGCIDEGDMTERCINCDRNPDTKHIGEDHWEWSCPEYALIKTNEIGGE